MTIASLALALVIALLPPRGPFAPSPLVPRYAGEVGPRNALAAMTAIGNRLEALVALDIAVVPGSSAMFRASRYLATSDADHFVLSQSSRKEGGDAYEIVCPPADAPLLGGRYRLRGVFRVRDGGMHQGMLSLGLERVSPFALRGRSR